MYGSTIGSLKIVQEFLGDSTKSILWEKKGNQGQGWHSEEMDVPTGVSGNGLQSQNSLFEPKIHLNWSNVFTLVPI